jgi:zinc transport system ATP-binding protein
MADTILCVNNLSVSLGGQKVLNDISFSLHAGELLIILGPNGAGKSVLLRTLLGMHPYNGTITWKENLHIGFLPCDFLPPKDIPLTVRDFFSFRHIHKENIFKAFKKIDLKVDTSFVDKYMSELSTGQLGKVLIAWVLVDNPQAILLDEPFSHVDSRGRDIIFNALIDLCKKENISIILVSHDISKCFEEADRVLAVNRKIIMYDTAPTVLKPENLITVYDPDTI